MKLGYYDLCVYCRILLPDYPSVVKNFKMTSNIPMIKIVVINNTDTMLFICLNKKEEESCAEIPFALLNT